LVASKEENVAYTPLLTFVVDVDKLSVMFLNASSNESFTLKAISPSNTRYKMPIIRCLGVSLPPAIILNLVVGVKTN